jgi:hypothetical protein
LQIYAQGHDVRSPLDGVVASLPAIAPGTGTVTVAHVVQTDPLDRLFVALGSHPPFGSGPMDARRQARLAQERRAEQNRTRHLRLAIDLAGDERAAAGQVAKARERVDLWRRNNSCSPRYIDRWAEVLDLPPRKLAKAMASFGEWEDALFQNSPWSWAWS